MVGRAYWQAASEPSTNSGRSVTSVSPEGALNALVRIGTHNNSLVWCHSIISEPFSPDISLVIERAEAMSSKYSICILFEDLALEKQTVFFNQRLFSP